MQSFILNWYRAIKKKLAAKREARINQTIAYLTHMYKERQYFSTYPCMIKIAIFNKAVSSTTSAATIEEIDQAAEVVINKLARLIKITTPRSTFLAIAEAKL